MVQVAKVCGILCNLIGRFPHIKAQGTGADPASVPRCSEKSWRATQYPTSAIAHLPNQLFHCLQVPRVVSSPSAVFTENQENKRILPN